MKLITLNTMAGRVMYPLMKFFERHRDEIDIFCLQEVLNTTQEDTDRLHPDEYAYGDLFNKINAVLPGHRGFYAHFDDNPHRQSLAIFVKNSLDVEEAGDALIYQPKKPKEHGSHVISSRKIQYVTLNIKDGQLSIANFHGLWTGGSKKDTPERIEQSKEIVDFLKKLPEPKILCGDFNLLPNTESLRMIADNMRDLVAEYNITSTRTPLYRNYNDNSEPNLADYIFTTPELKIKKFEVWPDLASDHAPLYLEF